MHGLMQDWPLLCHRILDHAAIFHPDRPIISRLVEGPIHRTTYGAARSRALKVAQRKEEVRDVEVALVDGKIDRRQTPLVSRRQVGARSNARSDPVAADLHRPNLRVGVLG